MTQTLPPDDPAVADGSDTPAAYTFADMYLQPGDRLQIHCPTHPDKARHISRVVGYVPGSSFIVTVPAPRGVRAEFMENEVVVVQAFSRNCAFAFKCTVLNVCRRPLDYMHLTFPDRIDGSIIRKSTRVRVSIDAVASMADGGNCEVRLGNISATGALLVAQSDLGQVGDSLRVSFKVELHDVVSEIVTSAVILNTCGDEDSLQYGVEFRDLPAHERMILCSLIYQQMIENPRTIT